MINIKFLAHLLGQNVGHSSQNVGHVRMSDDFSFSLVLGDRICEIKRFTESGNRGSKPEIIFAVLRPLVKPGPAGNQTPKTTCSVLGPPYRRLLRSSGATEGLFFLGGRSPSPNLQGVKRQRLQNYFGAMDVGTRWGGVVHMSHSPSHCEFEKMPMLHVTNHSLAHDKKTNKLRSGNIN